MVLAQENQKPRGWLAIGIFLLWGATMAALAGFTLIFPGTFLDRAWMLNPKGHAGVIALPRAVAFLFPVLVLMLAAAGVGWLKRRYWGWVLALTLIGGNGLGDLLRLASGEWLSGAVGVVIAGALFFYMATSKMRAWFTRPV